MYNTIREIFPKVKSIYDSLLDEKSKMIFSFRMLFNLTHDYNYLFSMISTLPEFDRNKLQSVSKYYNIFSKLLNSEPSKKLIIYGAGIRGNHLYQLFDKLNWYCFCDKDIKKQKSAYCGLPVISPEELIRSHSNDFVVIAVKDYKEEVYKQLISMGFPRNNIIDSDIVLELELSKIQYFEAPIIRPQKNEVFVDAGCFNCDTSLMFREWCDGDYEKIYAFEPDPINFTNCKRNIDEGDIKNIEIHNCGLWSEDTVLSFNSLETSGSSIADSGNCSINVVSLDNIVKGNRVSFIKMDIEGAELEALKGARDTITKYRPKLAICIYHKPEDILEIPLFLMDLVPDYKFYIRHYSNYTCETVLYAI